MGMSIKFHREEHLFQVPALASQTFILKAQHDVHQKAKRSVFVAFCSEKESGRESGIPLVDISEEFCSINVQHAVRGRSRSNGVFRLEGTVAGSIVTEDLARRLPPRTKARHTS